MSAEANTSAGAPWVSWVTRSEEPAKLNVTFVPGLSFSIWAPSSVNVDFSDAAANTVMSPVMLGADDDALPVVVVAVSVFDCRAAGDERRRGECRHGDTEDGFHDVPPGVSMITVVALTTATATVPGSRPSSVADSLLISETTVKGPHCICTSAIT